MAFMSVLLPAPLVPMRPTTSWLPRAIEALSTATRPPKRTLDVGGAQDDPVVGHGEVGRRRRRPLGDGGGLGDRGRLGEPAVDPPEQAVAGRVADLDEPAREVHEQDEESEAAGEEGHDGVVGPEGGQADDPDGAEHRARPPIPRRR